MNNTIAIPDAFNELKEGVSLFMLIIGPRGFIIGPPPQRYGGGTKRRNASVMERGNSGFSQSLRGCRFSDTKAIMDFFSKRPRLNSFDQFTRANSHPPRPPPRPSTTLLSHPRRGT